MINPDTWGRFTAKGSVQVENKIRSLLMEAADAAKDILTPSVCRALVLIGGYGRGEGGVVSTPEGDEAHNNLDFLIITNRQPAATASALRQRVADVFQPLARRHRIAVDIGAVTAESLGRSPSLVMWYDMRFGHKTILGDPDYVPALRHFDLERIPAWDIRNLLVNRATLMTINERLLEGGPKAADRKLLIRHIVKAVIGYGDALLFFLGAYHWSYVEKQRRMRQRSEVPANVRRWYDQAAEFRYRPDFAAYDGRDIAKWMAELKSELAPIHLLCESKRIGRDLDDWAQYPRAAFRRHILEDFWQPRSWAKKGLAFAQNVRLPYGLPLLDRIGAAMLDNGALMRTLFPVVGYNLDIPAYRELACRIFDVQDTSIEELRRGYLQMWSQHGDINYRF